MGTPSISKVQSFDLICEDFGFRNLVGKTLEPAGEGFSAG
jgi:hypothetical protein